MSFARILSKGAPAVFIEFRARERRGERGLGREAKREAKRERATSAALAYVRSIPAPVRSNGSAAAASGATRTVI